MTLKQAIEELNRRMLTSQNGDNPTKRVTALNIPYGTAYSYENLAPSSRDGNANATDAEVYNHLQAYLSRRPGSTFSSVSLPIQEFADLYGESKLLCQLANPGGWLE